MPYKNLLTIVTMMVLTGSKLGAQERVSIDDLRQIESLIIQKDCGALYSFLSANPATAAGNDPLARELQVFIRDVESGNLNCFSAPAQSRTNANQSASAVESADRIY